MQTISCFSASIALLCVSSYIIYSFTYISKLKSCAFLPFFLAFLCLAWLIYGSLCDFLLCFIFSFFHNFFCSVEVEINKNENNFHIFHVHTACVERKKCIRTKSHLQEKKTVFKRAINRYTPKRNSLPSIRPMN